VQLLRLYLSGWRRNALDTTTQIQVVELTKSALPIVGALLGVFAGGWISRQNSEKQLRASKSIDFAERRVRDFYSPMMGYIQKIQSIANVRNEITEASNLAWQRVCERQPKPFHDHEKHFEPFAAAIKFENALLHSDVLPTYDRMVVLFTQNYWLASPAIQNEYKELVRFVQLWHRFTSEAIPREVLKDVGHSEERLMKLYELVHDELQELRQFIANESTKSRWQLLRRSSDSKNSIQ
jgi:hypothetical protein